LLGRRMAEFVAAAALAHLPEELTNAGRVLEDVVVAAAVARGVADEQLLVADGRAARRAKEGRIRDRDGVIRAVRCRGDEIEAERDVGLRIGEAARARSHLELAGQIVEEGDGVGTGPRAE